MADYSRFDKIDYDAELEDDETSKPVRATAKQSAATTAAAAASGPVPTVTKTTSNRSSSSSTATSHPIAAARTEGDDSEAMKMPSLDNLNNAVVPTKMTPRTKEGRLKFEYEGRTIYEWEQGLEEVNIYLAPPPGVPRSQIVITISHTHLKVGLKGVPAPFIDEDLGGPVKVDESTWTLDTSSSTGAREINISLCKMNKAEVWVCALKGRADTEGGAAGDGKGGDASSREVDAVTKEELRRKMLLERFQEEHPGFDFSGAEFNGMVPEARTFMDGVKR